MYVKGTNLKGTGLTTVGTLRIWQRWVGRNLRLQCALESSIGDGTVVQKLIDYACDNGVVPDLYNRAGKVEVTV